MNSIYHFFKEIYLKKKYFLSTKSLEQFPFPQHLLSCVNKGKFPDLAIKLNKDRKIFTGGELILPKHVEKDTIVIEEKMKKVFSNKELLKFKVFDIKHHFNGYFRVYQTKLK